MKDHKDYIREVLDTIRYSFSELMRINLFWVLLSLLIITIPPALAGLFAATYQFMNHQKVSMRTFIAGFKKYFAVSYLWFFIYILVVGLLLFNIDLGIQQPDATWIATLSGVYWVLLAVWLLLQIYSLSFLIQQDKPKVLLAIRNSTILWLKNPVFSFILSLALLALIVISSLLPPFWVLITGSLLAFTANLAVVFLISKEESTNHDEGEDERA